jgi:hypothetical protein
MSKRCTSRKCSYTSHDKCGRLIYCCMSCMDDSPYCPMHYSSKSNTSSSMYSQPSKRKECEYIETTKVKGKFHIKSKVTTTKCHQYVCGSSSYCTTHMSKSQRKTVR